jgi:hypothetical protein
VQGRHPTTELDQQRIDTGPPAPFVLVAGFPPQQPLDPAVTHPASACGAGLATCTRASVCDASGVLGADTARGNETSGVFHSSDLKQNGTGSPERTVRTCDVGGGRAAERGGRAAAALRILYIKNSKRLLSNSSHAHTLL